MRTREDVLHLAELRARSGLEPGPAQQYGDGPAGVGDHSVPASAAVPVATSVAMHDLAELARGDGPSLWCVCIASEADASAQATA